MSRLAYLLPGLLMLGCGAGESSFSAVADEPTHAEETGTDARPDLADAPATTTQRIHDRAVVKLLSADAREPWWIEERIAPQPLVVGDHEVGRRSIVRAGPRREVVWQPSDAAWLTDACRHPSGEWSAVGFDNDRRIFLARGSAAGVFEERLLEDPALASDPNAWGSIPRTVPRVNALTESSVAVVANGEDVVVTLMTEDHAVLAYRFARAKGAFERGPRTLVSPAMTSTPFLPIGGSYDDFDAVVAPYLPRLAINDRGQVFIAQFADVARLRRHNAVFGTSLSLVRDKLYPREATIDTLVTRVNGDGRIAFAAVVGTPDYEDEVFGITASDTRVAIFGRVRRELGRDNTELHAVVSELTADGVALSTMPFDALNNAVALTGMYRGDDLWIGGSEGWTQNPSGRSVLTPGKPFLIRLNGPARAMERLDRYVPSTGTHAELRALHLGGDTLFLGGLENGPLTHTGDADPALIRADGFFAIQSL